MHKRHDVHWTAVKRILRYIRGTIDHGLDVVIIPGQKCNFMIDVWLSSVSSSVKHCWQISSRL
ncbi:WRKY transcription factor-like protein [Gossypium australe]|uniref:WRKY transcription factor-like protein n=1 Tax=Gossypium australe TaxID=47621 RepID=A0A5B6V4X3_9ROSI|nr:WRKY transcription factor-like protein [Gossypium australe]